MGLPGQVSLKLKPRGWGKSVEESTCLNMCVCVLEEGAPSKSRQWQCTSAKTKRKHGAPTIQNLQKCHMAGEWRGSWRGKQEALLSTLKENWLYPVNPTLLPKEKKKNSKSPSQSRQNKIQTPLFWLSKPLQPDPFLLFQAHLPYMHPEFQPPPVLSWLYAFVPFPLLGISPPTTMFACQWCQVKFYLLPEVFPVSPPVPDAFFMTCLESVTSIRPEASGVCMNWSESQFQRLVKMFRKMFILPVLHS